MYTISYYNPPTLQYGLDLVDASFYDAWSVSSRTWSQVDTYELVSEAGVFVGLPVTVSTANACSGCLVTPSGSVSDSLPLGEEVRLGLDYASPGSATVTSSGNVESTFRAGDVPILGMDKSTTAHVRCDSRPGNRYPAGCVSPDLVPQYNLSSTSYPTIAKYVRAAIVANNSLALLDRTTNQSLIRANRRAACKNFGKKPGSTTDSCDEYPFASAYRSGVTPITEHVPLSENSAQGGNLGGFYVANRLLDNDPFAVAVT